MRALLLACALHGCALHGCAQPAARREVAVKAGALDATRFLASVAQRARAAGAGPLDPVAAMVVSEGEQIGSFVEVRTDRCVLALARAGGSVRDVDLFVYSDGGDRLGSDEAPEPDASVLICPPHPRRVFVAARVMAGAGMLAVGVMPAPPSRADAVARATGVRGRPGQDTGKLAAWPGLERKLRERRAALGSSWDDIRRVTMHVDPRAPAAVSVPIEARRCLDVLVTPSDQIRAIDATVVNEEGRVVARGRPPGRDRGFVLCSAGDETLTIMVRPRLSSGTVALVVARSPAGAAVELDESSWIDAVSPIVPLERAVERHARRTAQLGLASRELAKSRLEVGAPRALPVALARGCTRVDVIGGEPLGSFSAELWSDDGRRLSRAHGGELATLFYCGVAVKARVELAALERAGPVMIELRHDPKAAAALVDHPRAATALLERLDAATGPIAPRDAAGARILDAEAERRRHEIIDIPPKRCVDVIAAVDGAAHGISLGVAPRGERVTGERLCAAEQARRVTLEIGIASGNGRALLLVRPVD